MGNSRAIIIANTTKSDVSDSCQRVKDVLLDFAVDSSVVAGPNLQDCDLSILATNKDHVFVVTLGGDGTIVAVGRAMQQNQKPIIGINYGKLGFLAPFSFEKFIEYLPSFLQRNSEHLTTTLKANYLSKRLIFRVKVFSQDDELLLDSYAVNDCVIDIGAPFRALQYSIQVDDQSTPPIVGDGIIISTPTGSTAYNLSEMGPIVEPESGIIILTPKAAHKLSIRSFAVTQNRTVVINIQPSEGAFVVIDGQDVTQLPNEPCRVQVCDSRCPMQLVRDRTLGFVDTLSQKLNWGK